ncbi:MAG: DegT/DnrJ/EryC1/StrS family aminotransferase [Chitinophagales bacterium]
MKTIKFTDLITPHQIIKEELFNQIYTIYDNANFSSIVYTERLENKFAEYIGTKYAISVSNGTSAIHIALLTLGISEGDEVIVPTNTYIGSIWGILYLKAVPVFVDCFANTYNLDTSKIEAKISKKTKAIIGVHLYGQVCKIKEIKEICKKYKIKFIEDVSQAHGALYLNKKAGSFGDINCFSLYPSKNLGACGEGGIITTNNKNYYNLLLAYRNQGQFKKYKHDLLGFNYRMASIEAVSIEIKLKYLDQWNQQRINIAQRYLLEIKNKKIKLPYINNKHRHVFHLFVIQTKNRAELQNYLENNGIQTQIHYPIPCHLQKALTEFGYKVGNFPISEALAKSCLSLPMHPFMSNDEINYVINTINNF